MTRVEQRLGHELEKRVRFEDLVAELLERFLKATTADLDSEIEHATRRVAEFLRLDQAILIYWGDDPRHAVPTCSWTAPGCKPVLGADGAVSLPWCHRHTLARQIVSFSSLADLPPEAHLDKTFFEQAGIVSLITLPLMVEARVIGALVLGNQRSNFLWRDDTVHQLKLIADVFASMTERQHIQLELEERLRFESLMAQLAVRFINLRADELDGAIAEVQRHFCQALGLDRSSLFQCFETEPEALLLTHFYQNGDHRVQPVIEKRSDRRLNSPIYWVQAEAGTKAAFRRADVRHFFPWAYHQLCEGKSIVFASPNELPPEAAADREAFRRFGTQSTVVVPLFAGGTWLGGLSFAMVQEPRHWRPLDLRCFESVARTFANALARKRFDEALHAHQERLSLATECAGVGLWSRHIESNVIWGTPRLREMFEVAPGEKLTRESFARKMHPDDREQARLAMQRAMETGEEMRVQFRIVMSDGSVRWISARGRRLYDATGQPEWFMGAAIDQTERVQAEHLLRQSEERLRLVLEANSEGVWDWNILKGQTYFSGRYAEMLGYAVEELSTESACWKNLVHPEDYPMVYQALQEHIAYQKDFCVEFRMKHKTGGWCWVLSRGTVVERDTEGRALRMVGTHLDITRRKEAETLAQESERRFLLMANAAPVLIWAAGPDKACTFVNTPWLDFTGRTLEQELGQGWIECIHPDDREGVCKAYLEAFEVRRPCSLEYRLRRYDGQYRWISDHGVARYDSEQNFAGYIGSCVDITERKQAEAEAQHARQQLAHVGRVSTLGELAGSLAHELNQPLTSILSNAQAGLRFMNSRKPDQKELRSILEDIAEQDQRAGEVISRMRTLMKKGEAQMLPLDLNFVIREVLGLMRMELMFREVTLTTHLLPHLPLIRGDRIQLQQVMLNLAMNACESMNSKHASKHKLTIQTEPLGTSHVQVTVTDAGPGFPKEMLDKPFEPFHTTKPHGLGLGLPICRSIISAHGGRISLANNREGGATVRFALGIYKKD